MAVEEPEYVDRAFMGVYNREQPLQAILLHGKLTREQLKEIKSQLQRFYTLGFGDGYAQEAARQDG